MLRNKIILASLAAAFMLSIGSANAIPMLQLFGQNQDGTIATNPGITDDSWLVTGGRGTTIKIWAIGNTTGGGDTPWSLITDVHLLLSFSGAVPDKDDLTLNRSQIGGLGSGFDLGTYEIDGNTYTDTSIGLLSSYGALAAPASEVPTLTHDTPDGSKTLCVSGGGCDYSIGPHGILDNPDSSYAYIKIDDFSETGDSIANFNADDDTSGISSYSEEGGHIQAFEFTVPEGDLFGWHFDLVGWCESCSAGGEWVGTWDAAPYSHDLDGTTVPEPGVLALFGFGLLGLGLTARRRRKAA